MDKRRSGLRRRLLKAGTISFNQTCVISCTVRNMSDAGASLEIPSPLGIPDDFTLVVESDQLSRQCHVRWRAANRIGVAFG
jgi:hypothetical protein